MGSLKPQKLLIRKIASDLHELEIRLNGRIYESCRISGSGIHSLPKTVLRPLDIARSEVARPRIACLEGVAFDSNRRYSTARSRSVPRSAARDFFVWSLGLSAAGIHLDMSQIEIMRSVKGNRCS